MRTMTAIRHDGCLLEIDQDLKDNQVYFGQANGYALVMTIDEFFEMLRERAREEEEKENG